MSKKEFLKELEKRLEILECDDKKEIIDYYEELIEDGITNGKKEKDVVKDLGTIDNIIKGLEIKEKVDIANKRPSVSNGMKALIACMGILSLPLSLPIIIVVMTLIFVAIVLMGSFVVLFVALCFSAICGIVAFIVKVCTGEMSVLASMFGTGILMILFALSMWIFQSLSRVLMSFVNYIYNFVSKKIRRNK